MVAKNKEIDLVSERIAAIYGKAVFDAAEAAGNRAEVIEQLDSLIDDVLDPSPEFDKLLANPMRRTSDLAICDRLSTTCTS